MLKKFFALFLILSITTAQANVVSNNNLKLAFDELNYSLSVDWDQKDRAFYDAQMKKFQDEVKELQAQGLTNSEIVAFAKSQVKDEKLAKDIDTAFTMIQVNKLSEAEARKLVLDTVSKGYTQGASWRGEVAVYTTIAVVLVAALVVGLAVGLGGNVTVSTGSYCTNYTEYVCYDYYDSWGYYWYTDCYYETYCY